MKESEEIEIKQKDAKMLAIWSLHLDFSYHKLGTKPLSETFTMNQKTDFRRNSYVEVLNFRDLRGGRLD